jgi:hypothetical protein
MRVGEGMPSRGIEADVTIGAINPPGGVPLEGVAGDASRPAPPIEVQAYLAELHFGAKRGAGQLAVRGVAAA